MGKHYTGFKPVVFQFAAGFGRRREGVNRAASGCRMRGQQANTDRRNILYMGAPRSWLRGILNHVIKTVRGGLKEAEMLHRRGYRKY